MFKTETDVLSKGHEQWKGALGNIKDHKPVTRFYSFYLALL